MDRFGWKRAYTDVGMNSRERAEKAMPREVPDRVPVVPLIDTSYAAASFKVPVSACFLDPALHARALVSVLERHSGIDGLSINIGLTPEVILELTRTDADYCVTTLDGSKWQFSATDLIQFAPKAIYEESRAAIRKAQVGGGFILSSGCALGRDTPPGNVKAMVQAAMDYGPYE